MVHPLVEHIANTPILPRSLALWGLGQMGVIIKGPDAVIVIDPYLSNYVEEQAGSWWARAFPPPIPAADLSIVDYVLISHEHWDHLDPGTVPAIAAAAPQAQFITTGWCRSLLRDLGIGDEHILTPAAHTPFALADTRLIVTPIAAAHYTVDYEASQGYRWLGFHLQWNDVTVYHSGDTILYPELLTTLQQQPRADVALVAANGRDYYRETGVGAVGNLHPAEVAQWAAAAGWSLVIPGHNDLFPNNGLPLAEIAQAFQRYAPRQAYKFLQPGELLYFRR